MEGSEHCCPYDSTWEEEEGEEEREEPPRSKGKEFIRMPSYPKNKVNGRQRNLRAAKDMQNYRHGYPDLEDEESDDMPNLSFYMNQTRFEPNGVLIEDLLKHWYKDYPLLEQSHSYIQWLFPLRESGMNWCARPLSQKELQSFKDNKEVMQRFVRAYQLMLNFYGIKLVDEETGALQRDVHYVERFRNLDWHSHNNLRITRILKCLGEMGYEHYQVKLVKFFLKETLKERELPSVKQSALDYFLFTVRDKRQRRELVHYAWMHYDPQNRFAWGPHERLKRFKGSKSSKQSATNSTRERRETETEEGMKNTGLVTEEPSTTQDSDDSHLESETVESSVDGQNPPVDVAGDTTRQGGQSQLVKGKEKESSMGIQSPDPKELEVGDSGERDHSGNPSGSDVLEQGESRNVEGGLHPVERSMGTKDETPKEVKKRKLATKEEATKTETSQSPSSGGAAPKILHDASTNKSAIGDSCLESSEDQKESDPLFPANKKIKVEELKRIQSNGPEWPPATEEGKDVTAPESKTECVKKDVAGAAEAASETEENAEPGAIHNFSVGLDIDLVETNTDVKETKENNTLTATETKTVLEETRTVSPDSQQASDRPHIIKAKESNTWKQVTGVKGEAQGKNEGPTQVRVVNTKALNDGVPQDEGLCTNFTEQQEQQKRLESPSQESLGETQAVDPAEDLVTVPSNAKTEESTMGDVAILERAPKIPSIVSGTAPRGQPTNDIVQSNCERDADLGSSGIPRALNEQQQECNSSAQNPDKVKEGSEEPASQGQVQHKNPAEQHDCKPPTTKEETEQGGSQEQESSKAELTTDECKTLKHN